MKEQAAEPLPSMPVVQEQVLGSLHPENALLSMCPQAEVGRSVSHLHVRYLPLLRDAEENSFYPGPLVTSLARSLSLPITLICLDFWSLIPRLF